MKIRLFRKKFKLISKVDKRISNYYVRVIKGDLVLYNINFDLGYIVDKFSKLKVLCLNQSSENLRSKTDQYPVEYNKHGYIIGCCFISNEQLQAIKEEFNYKVIFR